jgi:DNA sulfur modification protein DndD
MRAQVEEASTLAVRSLSDEPEYDSIAISSSYKISLRKKSGLEVPIPSSGYSQIVAMSFLFGLGWVSGSDNTVVIDTPLGRLDLENRENMLDWIRSRQNQTIIFLQNGELTEAETRNAFAGKLASQIQIERVTSDTSRFVEIGG